MRATSSASVVSSALAILLAVCAPSWAQTGITGTWQVEGVGPGFPWEVVLRVDGTRLAGAVSSCASNRVEIHDGRVNGNTITFKCDSLDGDHTLMFTGRVNGDQIAFSHQIEVRDGDDPLPPNIHPLDGMFGAAAPARYVAKRVPDGDFAEATNQVRGIELAAAVNLLQEDVKAEGTLFLPEGVSRVRAMIVAIGWGLGTAFYNSPQIHRLSKTTESALLLARFNNVGPSAFHDFQPQEATGGGEALLLLLRRLAEESGHRELADAPLLFWGQSVAGPFGTLFGKRHPQRTIAFVRYHSGPVGTGDMSVLSQIPALFFAGGKDSIAAGVPLGDGKALWQAGRSAGASWTYAVEPEATHGGIEHMEAANALVIPWITAVMRQRLSTDGGPLRVVTDRSAWMGNSRTGEVAPYGAFSGSKPEASWLPDEQSARAWRAVESPPRR